MEIARDLALPQNGPGGYGIRPYALFCLLASQKPTANQTNPPQSPKKVCGGFCVQRGRSPLC